MSQRVVLITGANKGIGLGLAKQFKLSGYKVLGTARKPQDAQELKQVADAVLQLDVASIESIKNMAAGLKNQRIDVLVNNAGIAMLGNLNYADVELEFRTNTFGPLFVTEHLLTNLKQSDNPTVVCVSSSIGSIGDNTSGKYISYRATKSALNQIVKTLSIDQPHVKFLALCPGYVATNLNNFSGSLKVEDSTRGIMVVIDKVLNGEEKSGLFISHTGKHIPW